MTRPIVYAPALVEAWGGKTGDISGVVPAMPGGHVGDVWLLLYTRSPFPEVDPLNESVG